MLDKPSLLSVKLATYLSAELKPRFPKNDSKAFLPPLLKTFLVAGSPSASCTNLELISVFRRLAIDPCRYRLLPAFASCPTSRSMLDLEIVFRYLAVLLQVQLVD